MFNGILYVLEEKDFLLFRHLTNFDKYWTLQLFFSLSILPLLDAVLTDVRHDFDLATTASSVSFSILFLLIGVIAFLIMAVKTTQSVERMTRFYYHQFLTLMSLMMHSM